MQDEEAFSGVDRAVRTLTVGLPRIGALLDADRGAARAGHHDTIREICQQPATWRAAARLAEGQQVQLRRLVGDAGLRADPRASIVLTGSGSSHYVGACVAPSLQRAWGRHVRAVASGDLLTEPDAYLPTDAPCLVVSFGRSGDSPESAAVIGMLAARPATWQLLITCDPEGRMARGFHGQPGIEVVLLDERTNDRSLVMTSSFTNMVLTARLLEAALLGGNGRDAEILARCGDHLMRSYAERLEEVVAGHVRRVLYLGTGSSYGASLEAALKMLEMTGGRVETMAESFLGVRHGPMAGIDRDTLVVCFLSSDPTHRAYEIDLVAELNAKQIGGRRVLVGEQVESALLREGDLGVEWERIGRPALDDACVLHVLVGQWLAFWRCLREGLAPDAPSAEGVITRVVPPFPMHPRVAGAR